MRMSEWKKRWNETTAFNENAVGERGRWLIDVLCCCQASPLDGRSLFIAISACILFIYLFHIYIFISASNCSNTHNQKKQEIIEQNYTQNLHWYPHAPPIRPRLMALYKINVLWLIESYVQLTYFQMTKIKQTPRSRLLKTAWAIVNLTLITTFCTYLFTFAR